MKNHGNVTIIGALLLLGIGLLFIGLNSDSDTTASGSDAGNGTGRATTVTSLQDISAMLAKTPKKDRDILLSEGEIFAKARQAELAQLAKTQPARVLKAMMSLDELAALPPEILAESEKPFNAVVHIDLQWFTHVDEGGTFRCTHRNVALFGDKVYPLAGEDYLEPKSPIANIPVSGYLIDGTLLLAPGGVRNLTPAEISVAKKFFPASKGGTIDPVTGRPGDPELAAVIGGSIHQFEDETVRAYVSEELAVAAKTQQGIPPAKFTFIQASSPTPRTLIDFNPAPLTTNNPKLLYIRVKFPLNTLDPTSHLSSAPVGLNELSNDLANVNATLGKFSYGQASIDATVTPKVYTLVTPALVVATEQENQQQQTGGSYRIMQEAKNAASADYNLSQYDIVAVYFPNLSAIPNSKITFVGQASTGGKTQWINGVDAQVREHIITHECGHNYGLFHANFLDPEFRLADGITPYFNNVSIEYGDIFDKMSFVYQPNTTNHPSGNLGDRSYFNPFETSRLSWMPSSKVMDVSASGTFRIYRFDQPNATSNPLLALRVPMGGDRYHWLALREAYDETKRAAYITDEGTVLNASSLVDATPGSKASAIMDRLDSALPLNQSYRDNSAGVTFTTTAAGGDAPNQFIEVRVDFDSRVGLESTNIQVDESSGNAVLNVRRTFDLTTSCSVSYATTPGTATSGSDYYDASGTLTWAAGDASPRKILIPIRPDSIIEGGETFTLTLSSPVNTFVPATIKTATVTILDAGNRISSFSPPFFNTTVSAIAPLPDGSVIAGGTMTAEITGNIAKFDANGSENATFRTNKGTGFNGSVSGIIRQADGKLIVCGNFTSYNGTSCPALARIGANGLLDMTDTAFCATLGTGANATLHAIGQLPDGNLLIGGDFTKFNGIDRPGIVKLSPTGSPLSFSPAFNTSIAPKIRAIDVAPDGKVMIAGQFATGSGSGGVFKFSIARVSSNGVVDPTFNPGFGAHALNAAAVPPVQLTSTAAFVTSVARLEDSGSFKYLIAGLFQSYNGVTRGPVALINADGSLNTAFNAGIVNGTVLKVFASKSGRLLAAGSFSTPANRIVAFAKTGAIDPSLNLAGGTTGSFVEAIASDSNGDIYIGGNFFNFAGNSSTPIVKIAGGMDSYSIWRNTVFTPAHIAAGNTGSEQDFDSDGILNITEMALGLSPIVANSPNSFTIAAGNLSLQTSGGSRSLQASMQRSAENLGIWLVAQFSSDLTNWLPANPVPGSNATYEVTESNSTRFTVKDNTPSGAGVKRFVRFRAVVPN